MPSCVNKVGFRCKLYMNEVSYASPTWQEIKQTKDVTVNLSKGQADTTDRNDSWMSSAGAQKELSLDFGYQHKVGTDDIFDALWDSYVNDTCLEFYAADGDVATAGTKGVRFWGYVQDMSQDQPLSDSAMWNITVQRGKYEEPAGTIISPEFYTIAAGSP